MPAGAPDPAKIDAEAVYAEFLRRNADGDAQNFSELCNRHPQLAVQLLDLHERNETVSMPQQALTDGNGAGAADFTVVNPQAAPPRYGILERLAQGGMGIIYKAWDGRLRRELAMKLIRDKKNRDSHTPATSVSPESLARFVREAEITARLDHPGVVPIHDMGTDEQGRVFFTMRLVQGQRLDIVFDLARLQVKRWSQTRVLDVIVKICETVAFAHSRGVIHRDLKPSNIMVGRFGETYVMDWGLAKNLRDAKTRPRADDQADAETVIYDEGSSSPHLGTSDLLQLPDSDVETMAGAVLGTAAYMPPEQAAGQISQLDERSDIYSVGAILYELLSGRRPYAVPGQPIGRSRDIISSVIAGPPPSIAAVNPRVAAELVAICEKAMERRKEDRYQSMTEMAEDLRAYLENRVVRAHQTGAVAEFRKWVSRNRWTAVASATGLVVALALLLTVVGVQSAANTNLSAKNEEISKANEQILRETVLKEQALIEQTRARERADSELARAEGLILARASGDVVSTNPGQALLVALESARRQPSDAASTALLGALAAHHEVHLLQGHQASLRMADVSPDGARAVTASLDQTALVWDLGNGAPITWLLGHGDVVNVARFSPDGKFIATGSYDRTARLWDVSTGKMLAVFTGHEKLVWKLAFNRSGDRLATASFDGTARIWDVATGAQRLVLKGHAAEVFSVEFSPDDRQLLTGSADKTARLWDASSGVETRNLSGHEGGVDTARFSPDGSLVLTIAALHATDTARAAANSIPSREKAARIWSRDTGQSLALLPHPDVVHAAVFNRDGQQVLTGCSDGRVRLWNATSGNLVRELAARGGAIHVVDFSPDDRLIAAGADSGKAWLWDATTGRERALLAGHAGAVRTIAFASPDTLLTASLDRTARVWRVRTPGTAEPAATADYRDNHVEVDSRAERLLARPVPSSRIGLYRIPDGDRLAVLDHDSSVSEAHFSPTGSYIGTLTESGIVRVFSGIDGRLQKTLDGTGKAARFAFDGEARLVVVSNAEGLATSWNLDTWSLDRRWESGNKSLVLRPDGRRIVAWSAASPELELWNAEEMSLITVLRAMPDAPRVSPALNFSNDGRKLATWLPQRSSVQLWDTQTGRPIATLNLDGKRLNRVSLSPDGRVLTTGADKDAASLWDADTGALLSHLSGYESAFEAIFVGPNGDRAVTRSDDKLSRLWNGRTGVSLGPMADRNDFVQSATFNSDGRLLLTLNGKFENACLWDAVDNRRLAQVFGGRTAFARGVISPEGRWFVIGCKDGTTRICPTSPVEFVRGLGLRELTADERDLFEIGTPQERAERRIAWNEQSLVTLLTVATNISLSSPEHQAAVQTAVEHRLREFVKLGTLRKSADVQTRLAQLERAISRHRAPSPPVAAAFATLSAELDAASRAE